MFSSRLPATRTPVVQRLPVTKYFCNFNSYRGTLPVKRPPKTPDRAYPLVKNQEYAYAYDWEYRPG